jgi:hypothetical protein
MNDDLRTIVARRLSWADGKPPDGVWWDDGQPLSVWRKYLPVADAALAAIKDAGFVIEPKRPYLIDPDFWVVDGRDL